jgi:hypothetical protein
VKYPDWRPEGEDQLKVKSEETVPVTTQELQERGPLDDPGASMAACLPHLSSEDWSILYNSITTVRRLAISHPQECVPVLKQLTVPLCIAAQNLRSSIMRNSLFCVKEMFEFVGEPMLAELQDIINCLVQIMSLSKDKKFVRDLAMQAAKAAVIALPAEPILNVLLPFHSVEHHKALVSNLSLA